MRAAVLLFPGLNRENDAMRALQQAGIAAAFVSSACAPGDI